MKKVKCIAAGKNKITHSYKGNCQEKIISYSNREVTLIEGSNLGTTIDEMADLEFELILIIMMLFNLRD